MNKEKERVFNLAKNTPQFVDVFFDLFIALFPFFLVSMISYIPIQLSLLTLCMVLFYVSTDKLQPVIITLSFNQSFFLSVLFIFVLATWGKILEKYDLSDGFSMPFLIGISSYLVATWPILTRGKKTIMKQRRYSYRNWYWGVSCFFAVLFFTQIQF